MFNKQKPSKNISFIQWFVANSIVGIVAVGYLYLNIKLIVSFVFGTFLFCRIGLLKHQV